MGFGAATLAARGVTNRIDTELRTIRSCVLFGGVAGVGFAPRLLRREPADLGPQAHHLVVRSWR